ncbi:hypothetical protein CEXT_107271 [Caerostris extrusa]|uniref:Uncharacterized protein n=1 Tax=Caerostris extrusa TaxID=172846 RepID=A0AAV4T7B8_CAEEX|nr:hypothetical protein CEXT_107271 [Caerostris extrusa]
MNGFRLILHSNLPLCFVMRKKIPLKDVVVILDFDKRHSWPNHNINHLTADVISAFFLGRMVKAKILSTANTGRSFTRSASWSFAPIARDNGMRRGTTKEIFSVITMLITSESPASNSFTPLMSSPIMRRHAF